MQTKTYFAGSIPAALDVARQELGIEALLVGARPAPPEMRTFGRLEVTFAWDPEEKEKEREKLKPKLRVDVETPAREDGPLATRLAAARLAAAGFSSDTAAEIAAAAALRPGDPDVAVVRELAARMPVCAAPEMAPGQARVLAFIGPPGRGKTTTLVKIAMQHGLSRRIPVRIYTAGAHCVGGQEQMARFASILGIPWQACESLAGLNLALNGDAWKGLVLIDTPGLSPADEDEPAEFARFFAARPDIEKHLVLRADATSADMLHVISRFSALAPARLLFTGLDEAVSMAPVAETMIRAGVPATFTGTGRRIPEDLGEIDPERLARSVWMAASATSPAPGRAKFAVAAA